jgi:hypothetical protein
LNCRVGGNLTLKDRAKSGLRALTAWRRNQRYRNEQTNQMPAVPTSSVLAEETSPPNFIGRKIRPDPNDVDAAGSIRNQLR